MLGFVLPGKIPKTQLHQFFVAGRNFQHKAVSRFFIAGRNFQDQTISSFARRARDEIYPEGPLGGLGPGSGARGPGRPGPGPPGPEKPGKGAQHREVKNQAEARWWLVGPPHARDTTSSRPSLSGVRVGGCPRYGISNQIDLTP